MPYNSDTVIHLHIYGDSILRGIVLDEKMGRYIPFAGNDFAGLEQYGIEIVNKAKFGATVDRGQMLLHRGLQNLQEPVEAILLEYGGNDCNHNWREVSEAPDKDHAPVTPLSAFTDTLREMVFAIRSKGIVPVLASLPPIDAEKYFEYLSSHTEGADKSAILHWLNDDIQMIYRYQEMYSSAVIRLACETGTLCVDLRSAFLDRHSYHDLFCADGIHPNEAGHVLLASALRSFAPVLAGVFRPEGRQIS